MFKGFSFIPLRVRDVDEAIDFYTGTLGFYLLRKYSFTPGGPAMAYVGLNGVLLELFPASAEAGGEQVGFGIEVANLDEAMAHLRSRGIEIVREQLTPRTFWGRQAGILDPSGHRISLREWHAPDGPAYAEWQPNQAGVTRLA
jgi:catechol 2,3-dioxygenase-like lactoylglutathione lyase family enzyme